MSKNSFHKLTVRDIHTLNRATTIVIDEALVESVKSSVQIELRDAIIVYRDWVFIDSLKIKKEDGEILSLSTTSTGIELVVEWNDFSLLLSETRAYKVQFREFSAIPCL